MLVLRRVGLAALVALAAACSIATQPNPGPGAGEPVGDVEPAKPGQPTDPSTDDGDDDTEPKPDDEPDPEPQSTTPGDILGTLSGSCGIVKTLLTKATPTFEKNTLAFVAG